MAKEFFDKLGDSIAKGANIVADKGNEFIDIAKLKTARMKLENQREDLLKQLGRLFYDMSRANDVQIAPLQNKCTEIAEIERQITQKRAEEDALKG